MEMKEFVGKLRDAVAEKLGKAYLVQIKEIQKNNGVILNGMVILSEEHKVVPTLYLEPFWEAYCCGIPLGEIVKKLLEIYLEEMPKTQIDMGFFEDFSLVKERICYRLVRQKGNEKFLEDIPFLPFLDLAVCFFYAYSNETLGDGAITVRNSHVQLWKTSIAELIKLAEKNTPRLFPWQCDSIETILQNMIEEEECEEELPEKTELGETGMLILSNAKHLNGAACMIYPKIWEILNEGKQCSYYILPSSIHEVILLPDEGLEAAEDLKQMIAEVNRTQVAPEEVLSDSLYYYDGVKKRIKIIF